MVPVLGFGIGVFGTVLMGLVIGLGVTPFLLLTSEKMTDGLMKGTLGAILITLAVIGTLLVVVPRGYDGPATYVGVESYHDWKGELVQTPKVQIEGFDGLYDVTNTKIAAYKAGDTVHVSCVMYTCEVK